MKKRILAMLLVTLFLFTALLPAAGAAGSNLLANVPYYGDSARCKMTPEMARAYAKVLRNMSPVAGPYDRGFRPEAFLADPAGDGVPLLVTAYTKVETDRNVVDDILPDLDTDTVKWVEENEDVDVWGWRNDAAYKAIDRVSWHTHFGTMDGVGLITSFSYGVAVGGTDLYNLYSVSNGEVELAHQGTVESREVWKGDESTPMELTIDGWCVGEEGDRWEVWYRMLLDDENVTLTAISSGASPFVSAVLDYQIDRPVVVNTLGRKFLAQSAVPVEELAEALETYAAAAPTAPTAPTTPAATSMAAASTQSVELDGKKTLFQMYALLDENGYQTNYVKLRDVAYALNGTAAQFNVVWTPEAGIQVVTGQAYQPDGSEMRTPFSGDRAYTVVEDSTTVDGEPQALDAIRLTDDNGSGYTYYKLRDLGKYLGFYVDWSSDRGVFVETDKGPGGAPKAKSPQEPEWAVPYLRYLETFQPEFRGDTEGFFPERARVIFGDFDHDLTVEMLVGMAYAAGADDPISWFYDLDAEGKVVRATSGNIAVTLVEFLRAWENQRFYVLEEPYGGSTVGVRYHAVRPGKDGVLTLECIGDFNYGDVGGGPYRLNGEEVDKATLEAAEAELKSSYLCNTELNVADSGLTGWNSGKTWGYDLWLETARSYGRSMA